MTATQVVPPRTVGCPGFTTGTATFDGSTCVSTPPLARGQTFTVIFPKVGNYKLVCLVHDAMTGTIHVLDTSVPLPHYQDYYNAKAIEERKALLSDTDQKMMMAADHNMTGDDGTVRVIFGNAHVAAGVGEIAATPGGVEAFTFQRFLNGTVTIHAGDTVEWENNDPAEPHTITFGTEPANTMPPSPNVTVDQDGVRHAIIMSNKDNVHSGFIRAGQIDSTGLPQNPLGHTRFRITFTHAGTYNYICALHDQLGMTGTIIVVP